LAAGLTSACPQIEVKDHPASSGVRFGQQVESQPLLAARPELPLQISSYPDYSQYCIGNEPINWPKMTFVEPRD
jgi:hypothetical protein